MDLQSGKLYWPTTYPNPKSYPQLEEDISCDVLIVGGGSSGAQCAHYLADTGLEVVLIDKGRFASGSTASNTALIQYAGDKMFVPLMNTFGEAKAAQHLKLCEEAINEIEAVCGTLPDSAEFSRRDSLYYASCEEDVPSLEQELKLLQKHGFKVDYWTREQIIERYPIHTPGALYYHNDGELNPIKFTHGLLESAHSRKIRLYEQTEWKGHRQEKDAVVMYTHNQHLIKAGHVIFASGYGNQSIKPDKNAVLSSSYNLVTEPVSDLSLWLNRILIWETARPYIYLRTTPDNRIIIGGLDESTMIAEERDRHIQAKKEQLLTELNRRFPDIQVEAEFYLGAFYGGTHDGLPILGVYDEFPRCTFLNAYGDNGLVYSMVLARILRDRLTMGSSPSSDLYLQTR
ncbi:MAG: FAD-binding oxidoreductase [Paenibacillus sp.]|nr:FAD-binding oxidoreductase [Paenibacillus sp.]